MTPKIDKGAALADYLESKGARIRRERSGYQQIPCINDAAHHRGDRRPSASVHIERGKYRCFACDLHGDVIDLIMVEKSLTYAQALATLSVFESLQDSEDEWNVWL